MQPNNNWYVAYTYPKYEKKVDLRMKNMGIDSYLPLTEQKRQWSDRVKKIEAPLFPCYLFVRTSAAKVYDLEQINGLMRFVSFDQELATISENEINAIKRVLAHHANARAEDRVYMIGERVRIGQGPLAGMEGMLIRKNSSSRFVIQITTLNRSIEVDIPTSYLRYC
ncbi:MAG: UpxY family transcription antiterminator [Bacteroidota bacterium]